MYACPLIRRLWLSSGLARQHLIRRNLKIEASSDEEKKLADILRRKFNASEIQVKDVSGGCGAMYEIFVESEDFRGKRTVMQHSMINQALAEEIKEMHGLRIFTAVPNNN